MKSFNRISEKLQPETATKSSNRQLTIDATDYCGGFPAELQRRRTPGTGRGRFLFAGVHFFAASEGRGHGAPVLQLASGDGER